MIPVDLKRLLDHEVELFGLDLKAVWNVIQAFVRHCDKFAADKGDLQVASDKNLDKFRKSNPYISYVTREEGEPSVETAMTHILRRPRVLKHALRRTWLAWQELHGEVSLEDLLVYNAIHTLSSETIGFIRDHWSLLVPDSQSDSRQEREAGVPDAWDAHIKEVSDSEKRWLRALMKYMFASPRSSKAQGITKERYWGRIANGRIEREGVRDQEVIKDVKAWKDSEDPSPVIGRFMNDAQYTDVFEGLFEYGRPARVAVRGEDVLQLASLLFEEMRTKFGVRANYDCCPGFIPLWRLQSRGRQYKAYEGWLWTELKKTMPVSLLMRNDLEYYWGSRRYSPLDDDAIGRLRHQTAQWGHQHLDATKLAALLSDVPVYVLLQLVAGSHHDNIKEPLWDEWRWLNGPLLESLVAHPYTMIPQAACLFVESGHRYPGGFAEEDDPSAARRLEAVYHVRTEWIKQLFPALALRKQYIDAILRPADKEDEWSSETKDLVHQVRQDLLTWEQPEQEGAGEDEQ